MNDEIVDEINQAALAYLHFRHFKSIRNFKANLVGQIRNVFVRAQPVGQMTAMSLPVRENFSVDFIKNMKFHFQITLPPSIQVLLSFSLKLGLQLGRFDTKQCIIISKHCFEDLSLRFFIMSTNAQMI